MNELSPQQKSLFTDVKTLIDQSRKKVAKVVNTELSMLYWHVGKRIHSEILQDKRAEYGKQVIKNLSAQLTEDFGRGWGERQLRHCVKFASTYPEKEIVYTLCIQLSWSHIRSIIFIENPLKRDFYIEICQLENWSVKTLQGRIKSMLFERTAISKKPEETIKRDLELLKNKQQLSPDLVFRDPYFLDFLGLHDSYSEEDLETTILAELQRFISELGTDFAFLARQKRLLIDHKDYKIDLLFFHRRLKCLIAIDLKIGEFEAGFKGQMELYLNYLKKHEMMEGENPPIGLILCTGKTDEHIELIQLKNSNIKVSEYWTVLPPAQLLKEKLHKAIVLARSRWESKD
jgi:predicted nuclease of restriction endonuclease-like (RecB) superfamily